MGSKLNDKIVLSEIDDLEQGLTQKILNVLYNSAFNTHRFNDAMDEVKSSLDDLHLDLNDILIDSGDANGMTLSEVKSHRNHASYMHDRLRG